MFVRHTNYIEKKIDTSFFIIGTTGFWDSVDCFQHIKVYANSLRTAAADGILNDLVHKHHTRLDETLFRYDNT